MQTLMRTLVQGLVLMVLFLVTWKGLSRVEWRTLLRLEEISRETESRLGENLDRFLQKMEPEFQAPEAREVLDSLVFHLASGSGLEAGDYHLHLVKSPQINAFALPGSQIVVYSALMTEAESPEMLAGVLAHEMAHIRLGHVKKKLVKEVGLAMVLSASGNATPQVLQVILKHLSSTAFDRNLESEADEMALEMLQKAGIDPRPTGLFFQKIARSQTGSELIPDWLSTHPESADRARLFLQARGGDRKSLMSPEKWEAVRKALP